MIKAVSSFVLGTFFRSALNIISVIWLSNIIGPGQTGNWVKLYAALSIFQFFLEMGQASILLKRKEKFDEIVGFVVSLNIISTLIFLSIYLVISTLNNDISLLIIFLIMLTGLASIANIAFLSLQISEKFYLNQAIPLSILLISLFATGLYSLYDQSFMVFVFKFIVECTLSVLISVSFIARTNVFFKFRLNTVMKILSLSDFYLAVGEFIFKFGNQFDKLILAQLTTPEFLGAYGRSQSLTIQGVAIACSSINPLVFQKSKEFQARNLRMWLFLYYFALGTIGSILFYLLGDYLILILFGDQWLAIILSTKFLTLFPLIRSLENYYFLICNLEKQAGVYVIALILTYTLSLITATIFYHYYGDLRNAIVVYCTTFSISLVANLIKTYR